MRVIFRKQVHAWFAAASSDDVWLRREFELPESVLSLLQPGNEFQAGDFEATISMVSVVTEPELHLDVWTPADDTLYQAQLRGEGVSRERALKEAEEWVEAGWEIEP